MKWPLHLIERYNEEIQKRRIARRRTVIRKEREDRRMYPRIWEMPINEVTVFALASQVFPCFHVIAKIINQSIDREAGSKLYLSTEFMTKTKRVHPAYYSDRERLVVILNKYRLHADVEDLVKWAQRQTDDHPNPYWNLILGLLFLDRFLGALEEQRLLLEAILHLKKVEHHLVMEDSKTAAGALLAFCFYLNNDFSQTLILLKKRPDHNFHKRFLNLIESAA